MKNLILTSAILFLFSNSIFSQNNKELNPNLGIMEDSLWRSLRGFYSTAQKYLEKEFVTQKDVKDFLTYVYNNMEDSVQSTNLCIPKTYEKNIAIKLLTKQTRDLINSKCNFSFISWDGWDGKTAYTGFDFDIHHNNYKDQFLVILNTKGRISSIFSINSVAQSGD